MSTEAAEKETSYPVTVTDQADRTVTIEKEPAKIVSGYYIPSSLLIALGLSDKMVGIEAKADKRPIYKLAAPELLELPNVGTAKEFDLETCASLSPDLVILPLKLKDAAKSLTELGIPVLLVNPESPDQLSDMISLIATATNTGIKQTSCLTSFIRKKKCLLLLLQPQTTLRIFTLQVILLSCQLPVQLCTNQVLSNLQAVKM